MAEPPDTEQPPQACNACRGTGTVISNLGSVAHSVQCPWCEGGGVWLAEHNAQAHWSDPAAIQGN
jgi:DnaJ-class molecular chaperone